MARPKALDVAQAYAVRLMHDLVVPTFVLDPKRRVVVWNRACERLTGVLSSEVMGTSNHWRGFYERRRYCLADLVALGRPEKLEKLYPEHGIEPETGRFSAENWCVMPRLGNQLYLAIDAGPIHDVDGNLIAVVETLRDMTDQKRAETALQNLAAHDGLTGLANRRSFDQRLDMEWSRAQRARAPITLVLADVDHFKLFNDVHGHQKGDDCLRAVAATMRSGILRPGDLAARYGGEEFAIIMPNTDLKGACKVAERLRTSVLDLRLKHGAVGAGRHVTMSMGVATIVPAAGVEPEWLLEQADQALYAAKDAGRNFVAAAREGLVRIPQRKAGGRSR